MIEDSAADAEIIARRLMRSHRFEVSLTHCPTVAGGERTLREAAARADAFDLVIVDYWLDAGHSVDLLRRCGCLPDLPIVLLTGSDLRVVEDEAFDAGVAACLSKDDITGGALDSALAAALRGHARMRDERRRTADLVAALHARAPAHRPRGVTGR